MGSVERNFINVSKIISIHYFEFDKNFVFNGETHNYWEMVYVDKGCVSVCCGDEEITLTQGEAVFHRPNEFHSIRAFNSSPNFFVISFVCKSKAMREFVGLRTSLNKTLQSFISSIVKEARRTYVLPKNDPDMKCLVMRENASVAGVQLVKTYLEQLLILLIRERSEELADNDLPKGSAENHVISAVRKYIADNAEKTIYISELCSYLGYSKSYISKVFKEQTGTTINAYTLEVKITYAKNLIREGNLSFSEISDRLSFDNPQYFSRVFKRVTGMSPTEFKRSLNFESGPVRRINVD